MGMTETDDIALDAKLAEALGPKADDTAPLSRAVLNRLADPDRPRHAGLAEVLADPLPAAGLMLGLLLIAGGLGYALTPIEIDEVSVLTQLIAPGF
jgi:hypothetical protein